MRKERGEKAALFLPCFFSRSAAQTAVYSFAVLFCMPSLTILQKECYNKTRNRYREKEK